MVKSHPRIIDPVNVSEEQHTFKRVPKQNPVRLDHQVGKKNMVLSQQSGKVVLKNIWRFHPFRFEEY